MPGTATDRDVILFNLTPRPYPPVLLPRIEVSPQGFVRVRRVNRSLGSPLKPDYNRAGHPRVKLLGPDGTYRNVLLHRLVYYACTEDERMFGCDVVHLDGDGRNPHIENLRLRGEEFVDIKPLLKPSVLAELALHYNIDVGLPADLSMDAKLTALDRMLETLSNER